MGRGAVLHGRPYLTRWGPEVYRRSCRRRASERRPPPSQPPAQPLTPTHTPTQCHPHARCHPYASTHAPANVDVVVVGGVERRGEAVVGTVVDDRHAGRLGQHIQGLGLCAGEGKGQGFPGGKDSSCLGDVRMAGFLRAARAAPLRRALLHVEPLLSASAPRAPLPSAPPPPSPVSGRSNSRLMLSACARMTGTRMQVAVMATSSLPQILRVSLTIFSSSSLYLQGGWIAWHYLGYYIDPIALFWIALQHLRAYCTVYGRWQAVTASDWL